MRPLPEGRAMTGLRDHVKEAQERCSGDASARRWEWRLQNMVEVIGDSRNGVSYMRLTPYTDADGKAIYAGDVVDFGALGTEDWWRGDVYWDDTDMQWAVQPTDYGETVGMWECTPIGNGSQISGRVVGNVFEHPELLDEGRE